MPCNVVTPPPRLERPASVHASPVGLSWEAEPYDPNTPWADDEPDCDFTSALDRSADLTRSPIRVMRPVSHMPTPPRSLMPIVPTVGFSPSNSQPQPLAGNGAMGGCMMMPAGQQQTVQCIPMGMPNPQTTTATAQPAMGNAMGVQMQGGQPQMMNVVCVMMPQGNSMVQQMPAGNPACVGQSPTAAQGGSPQAGGMSPTSQVPMQIVQMPMGGMAQAVPIQQPQQMAQMTMLPTASPTNSAPICTGSPTPNPAGGASPSHMANSPSAADALQSPQMATPAPTNTSAPAPPQSEGGAEAVAQPPPTQQQMPQAQPGTMGMMGAPQAQPQAQGMGMGSVSPVQMGAIQGTMQSGGVPTMMPMGMVPVSNGMGQMQMMAMSPNGASIPMAQCSPMAQGGMIRQMDCQQWGMANGQAVHALPSPTPSPTATQMTPMWVQCAGSPASSVASSPTFGPSSLSPHTMAANGRPNHPPTPLHGGHTPVQAGGHTPTSSMGMGRHGRHHRQSHSGPAAMETDERRLQQRAKQIEIGKNTTGYARYRQLVSEGEREEGNSQHPITPPIQYVKSKREFDAELRRWRRALHFYDEEATEEMGSPSCGEESPHPLGIATTPTAQNPIDMAPMVRRPATSTGSNQTTTRPTAPKSETVPVVEGVGSKAAQPWRPMRHRVSTPTEASPAASAPSFSDRASAAVPSPPAEQTA